MPNVFISYRREDSSGYAGRINGRIERAVGRDSVFQDVADIAPGKQWDVAIAEAMAQCEIQLVIIGPRFLSDVNQTRLHDEDDLLRQEIAAGLRSARTKVVPVRVGGAELPTAAQLPADLARLTTRQDFELRDRSFDSDLVELLTRLGLQRTSRRTLIGLIAAAVVLTAVVAWIIFNQNGDGGNGATDTTTTTSEPTATTSTTEGDDSVVPVPFTLDDYTGVNADAAQASLESLELEVRRRLEGSNQVPDGNVISHTPAAGSDVTAGSAVFLVVSSGPTDVTVPETANTLQATAQLRLDTEGLAPEITFIASGLVGTDRVVRTDPAAGTVVGSGSRVRVFVSSGPASGCAGLFPQNNGKVGTDENIGLDALGNPTGFEWDVIRAVVDQMCGPSLNLVMVPLTAAERFAGLAAGNVDVLPTSKRSGDISLLYTTPYVLLDGGEPRGLAIRAGLNDERRQLNEALLEVIASGRWLDLHRLWLGEPSYTINQMLGTPLVEG